MAKQKTTQEQIIDGQIAEKLTEENTLKDIYETKKAEMLKAKDDWRIVRSQRENLQRDENI